MYCTDPQAIVRLTEAVGRGATRTFYDVKGDQKKMTIHHQKYWVPLPVEMEKKNVLHRLYTNVVCLMEAVTRIFYP